MPLRPEEATAYMHYSMEAMAEVAQLLNKQDDYQLYKDYAVGAKKAYNDIFLKEIPDTDRQAKLVRPIALGLAEGDKKKQLEERL